MPRTKYLYLLQTLMVFVLAFAVRQPIVDRDYRYSFEPDSQSCIEETRSFYFFFENPCKENVPHTLTSYPNYSDGDFIFSALTANAVRPLCKAGIINAKLSDADNSLIIFSMRWTNILLDSAAAAIAFLVLLLLIGNSFIALALTLLYYLLNPQTLYIDFCRIDHFTLFVSNMIVLATVVLFRNPNRKRYYSLAGIAVGLITATKINFPFYLPPLLLAAGWLLYQKKVSAKCFSVLLVSFLATFVFMYHRWLLYPESIVQTLRDTLQIGEEWFSYWGNDGWFFYLCNGFLPHGFSWLMVLLLPVFYASLIFVLVRSWRKKETFTLLLCIAFIVQMLALMASPKIPRYGIAIPLMVCICLGIAGQYVWLSMANPSIKKIAPIIFVVLLLPSFLYEVNGYYSLQQKFSTNALSIQKTRNEPLDWVKKNVTPNSIIAIQAPQASNPPIFELPFVFDEHYLTFPFLNKQAFEKFVPPSIGVLKSKVNYVVISNKEKDFQYYVFNEYGCDSALVTKWTAFYDSLERVFPHVDFASQYANYGVKAIRIYQLDTPTTAHVPIITARDTVTASKVNLIASIRNIPLTTALNFQVQIAEDSNMKWLVSGSDDGYPSKYRPSKGSYTGNGVANAMVPKKFMDALLSGFFAVPHLEEQRYKAELFFRQVLADMIVDSLTFRQSALRTLDTKSMGILDQLDKLYPGIIPVTSCHAEEYLVRCGLPPQTVYMINGEGYAEYTFAADTTLKKGRKYYWRTRLRFKDQIKSGWSNIGMFTIPK